jgi:hypothetical protein
MLAPLPAHRNTIIFIETINDHYARNSPIPPRRMTWKSATPADPVAQHLLSSAPFPELPRKA